LQYCNWSRKIFEYNRSAGLDAVHVTIVYHEDYHEFLDEIKKESGLCSIYHNRKCSMSCTPHMMNRRTRDKRVHLYII